MQATACLALHCNQDRICVDFWNLCVRDSAIAGHVIWARGVVLVSYCSGHESQHSFGQGVEFCAFLGGDGIAGGRASAGFYTVMCCVVAGFGCKHIPVCVPAKVAVRPGMLFPRAAVGAAQQALVVSPCSQVCGVMGVGAREEWVTAGSPQAAALYCGAQLALMLVHSGFTTCLSVPQDFPQGFGACCPVVMALPILQPGVGCADVQDVRGIVWIMRVLRVWFD